MTTQAEKMTIAEYVARYGGCSVSQATMRTQDLIPALLDVLMAQDRDAYDRLMRENPDVKAWWENPTPHVIPYYHNEWDEIPDDKRDDFEWFLSEELWPAMDALAPDGYYFGASEGDGSDYGYWPCEEGW